MSDFTNDAVNAFIVEYQNKHRLTYSQLAVVVNKQFNTNIFTRNAVMARYNRHGLGRKYENTPGGTGLRVARAKKLPHPRPTIEKPVRKPSAPRINYNPKRRDAQQVAENEEIAKQVRALAKSELFLLKPGMFYRTLIELENNTCRWPLEAEDGRIFYCGKVDGDVDLACGTPYCRVHTRIAESKWRKSAA